MRKDFLKLLTMCCVLFVPFSGCGYNAIQSLEEEVDAQWAEVVNQYKRRADLVPNLVKVVKGYAAHEKETLEAVVQARSRATQGSVPQLEGDGSGAKEFLASQDGLGTALSKLLVVVEQYPQLKADRNFRELQAQLEGTENRITVARSRFIESVKRFNIKIRTFPTMLTAKLFGYHKKASFEVQNEAKLYEPPSVDF